MKQKKQVMPVSMDKRDIYDGLSKLELDLESSLQQLTAMKAALQEIVEKNTKSKTTGILARVKRRKCRGRS